MAQVAMQQGTYVGKVIARRRGVARVTAAALAPAPQAETKARASSGAKP